MTTADAGLWPGPWSAEDGGPRRLQQPQHLPGLGIAPGERLALTAVRDALATTMVVLRDPGEVYVLRHTLGRRPLQDPSISWVEQIDPLTLQPFRRSPDLAAGPFWPGGMAAHADGSLHVVAGNHVHRLSADLRLLVTRRLPGPRPYNSFVVLADGTIVTKDFDHDLREPATLVLLDPATLERRCDDVALDEPAIARLSADGDDVYVVGARTVLRLHWDGTALRRDESWGAPYVEPGQSYGWDPVIAGGQLWFMDNGAHDFVTTMQRAGVSPGPLHLIRMSLTDPADIERVEVCGDARGAVTNPPLYDEQRRIAVAYDSANSVVRAFRHHDDGSLRPLWRKDIGHAAHMILYPQSGELVLHDFKGPALNRTRLARAIGRRATMIMRRPRLRALATLRSRDTVVVVDIATGSELGRVAVPSLMQSVVFPAPGTDRDVYWCTMTTLARIAVT